MTDAAGTLTLPICEALAEYLLDPGNGFRADDIHVGRAGVTSNSGTARLDSYVRFVRGLGHRKGSIGVDVRADGSVWLTHLGARYWRVVFDSPGNRVIAARVPATVIIAAIRAAIEEG